VCFHITQNNTKQLRVERTSGGHLAQYPFTKPGQLEPDAQRLVHVGFEDGVYKLTEEAVLVLYHLHSGLSFF